MSSTTLRFLAEPGHPNLNGKVHGGTVMKWIDEAGYACATSWARRRCVTVYIGGVHFLHPVRVGDLVEVQARLAYTGNTSMNIAVEVRCNNMLSGETVKTTECLIVFVSLDIEGKPEPVRQWSPETPGEMAVAAHVRAQLDASRAIGTLAHGHTGTLTVAGEFIAGRPAWAQPAASPGCESLHGARRRQNPHLPRHTKSPAMS